MRWPAGMVKTPSSCPPEPRRRQSSTTLTSGATSLKDCNTLIAPLSPLDSVLNHPLWLLLASWRCSTQIGVRFSRPHAFRKLRRPDTCAQRCLMPHSQSQRAIEHPHPIRVVLTLLEKINHPQCSIFSILGKMEMIQPDVLRQRRFF